MRFKRINESVRVLTEDKTVNPGGTPYPNHGWCVIVCGGPGMGKSSVVKNLINIDAKHLDIDEVKALWLKTTSIDDGILTTADGREYSMGAENISEPYDLSNPKFTSFVHQVTKPLAKNRQNAFIKAAGSHDKEKLPNVIFDITGDEIDKFMNIIDTVKPLGYKIAIVLVAGEISQAIEQNNLRSRRIDHDLLLNKHRNVLNTILNFFESSLVNEVDEFYVVVQFRVDIHTPEGKLKFLKTDNVYKVKQKGKQLLVPKNIQHLLISEYEKLISGIYDKTEE